MAQDIGTWVDRWSDRLGGHYILASLLLSVSVFLLALFIAWLGDFHTIFLDAPPVYFALFGIAWVAGWIVWSSRRLAQMLKDIRPVFMVPDGDFERATMPYIRRMGGIRLQALWSVLPILICIVVVAVDTRRGVVRFFPAEWRTPSNFLVKNLILDLYTIPVILLIVTAGIGIVNYSAMVFKLSKFPLNPILSLSRMTLRPIAEYGIGTGLAWSVGISLFGLLYQADLGPDSIVTLILLTILAMLMIVAPQYAIHVCLERTKLKVLSSAYGELAGGSLYEGDEGQKRIIHDVIAGGKWEITGFIHDAAEESTWVHKPGDLLEFAATWLLPVAIFLGKPAFTYIEQHVLASLSR